MLFFRILILVTLFQTFLFTEVRAQPEGKDEVAQNVASGDGGPRNESSRLAIILPELFRFVDRHALVINSTASEESIRRQYAGPMVNLTVFRIGMKDLPSKDAFFNL